MTDYEVELKFALADTQAVTDRLLELRAVSEPTSRQTDRYFAHPVRDFARTDEALRLRTAGRDNTLTYKGPLLDRATKTRQELELPVQPESEGAQHAWALLRALGFEDVRSVSKVRHPFRLCWEDRDFCLAIDDVDGLGQYLEIETIATHEDWEQARDSALRLAAELHLEHSERRSYLQLLMERT